VLKVQKFTTEQEVIDMANDTKYGLTAQVYTNDLGKAMRVANQIEAGMIWINTYLEGNAGCSVSPYKQSGLGTVGGVTGLLEFTKIKLIHIRTEVKRTGWFDN
jgi:betaine-aldehyde dehydrogenase